MSWNDNNMAALHEICAFLAEALEALQGLLELSIQQENNFVAEFPDAFQPDYKVGQYPEHKKARAVLAKMEGESK